ncbi:MAG TPA: C13 family peptidase [Pseudomonadales bacterium]|nr:C13 family peptidase [Pseudomonadales bacterium]
MLAIALRSFLYLLPANTADRLTPYPVKAFLFWLYINATGYYLFSGGEDAEFYTYGLTALFAYAGIVLLAASLLERQLNLTRYSLATLFFLQHAFASIYVFLLHALTGHASELLPNLELIALMLAFTSHLRIYLHLSKSFSLINRLASSAGIILCALLIDQLQILDYPMWYSSSEETQTNDQTAFQFNAEEALAMQPRLLNKQLAKIEASAPDSAAPTLYYLGFASYGGQQVFRREEQLAREKISARFHAEKHSISLMNQPSTVYEQPLASRTNLRKTLLALGKKMNTDKDVLWLFITSHGTHNKGAAISFYPFPLDANLEPRVLKSMLDEAGIKWRIIVVSACFSGYYVPELRDENTLILTAASAETTSFGCDDSEEYTYFGRALFNENFDNNSSLETIFQRAIDSVAKREQSENIDQPSQPQLFIGEAIKQKMEEFN